MSHSITFQSFLYSPLTLPVTKTIDMNHCNYLIDSSVLLVFTEEMRTPNIMNRANINKLVET